MIQSEINIPLSTEYERLVYRGEDYPLVGLVFPKPDSLYSDGGKTTRLFIEMHGTISENRPGYSVLLSPMSARLLAGNLICAAEAVEKEIARSEGKDDT